MIVAYTESNIKLTNCASIKTVTKTSDDATDNHVSDRISRCLESAADTEDEGTEHDGTFTTNPFAKDQGQERAKETADFVNGDDGTLERSTAICALVCVDLGELSRECVAGQETGHDSLVITKTNINGQNDIYLCSRDN